MRLYPESNIVIDSINLAMCRPYKDFGRGFYLTDIKEQAEKSIKLCERQEINMSKQEQLVEYIIQDIVDMFSSDQGIEYDEAINKFYNSKVFEKLQDKETGLYMGSSEYVYDLFKDEMNFGRIVQAEI